MSSVPARAAAIVLLLAGAFGPNAAGGDEWKAAAWPEADAIFHSDPRWLGADVAYSVPLDGDRVLWLFGDTFVGDGKVKRAKASFIRNSVAVQRGRDPARADLDFYWRGNTSRPDSYFASEGETWLWPLHGVFRKGALTLFFMRVNASNKGLKFQLAGSAARRCDRLADAPGAWRFGELVLPEAPFALRLLSGVAVLDEGDYVLAYCAAESGNHDAYLVRWPAADFDLGDLASPEWWDGERYLPRRKLKAPPAVVIPGAATEFSVHRLPDGRYVQVQSLGFGATNVGCRFAARPEGPWPDPEPVFRPRESRQRGAFVYAAKAHPELDGAPLIMTYVANHRDPKKLLRSGSLYYPRFVRLQPKPSR
jgi:hypothetical protein